MGLMGRKGTVQFLLLHRSRVTTLTRLCRPQEGEMLAGWELSSGHSPSRGSDALDGWPGARRSPSSHYVLILLEPQTHMTLTLGPSGPGQPTGPGIPGTPGGPGLPFKDQEQKSRHFGVLPSSQEYLRP